MGDRFILQRRWSRDTRTGIIPASGVLELNFGAPPPGVAWRIERIVNRADAAITDIRHYLNTVADENECEVDPSGAAVAVADESSPIYVEPQLDFLSVITGVAGTVCRVNIQYQILMSEQM